MRRSNAQACARKQRLEHIHGRTDGTNEELLTPDACSSVSNARRGQADSTHIRADLSTISRLHTRPGLHSTPLSTGWGCTHEHHHRGPRTAVDEAAHVDERSNALGAESETHQAHPIHGPHPRRIQAPTHRPRPRFGRTRLPAPRPTTPRHRQPHARPQSPLRRTRRPRPRHRRHTPMDDQTHAPPRRAPEGRRRRDVARTHMGGQNGANERQRPPQPVRTNTEEHA